MTKLFASLALALMAASVAGQSMALSRQPVTPRKIVVAHHHSARRGLGRNSIVHAVSHSVVAPVDISTGHATGRRQHKPIVLGFGKRQDGPLHRPLGARDAASGLPTGQRLH
jgi:hypothetical protein